MYRFISLLIIPLIFTFVFDHYAINDEKINIINKKVIKTYNLKENIVNVHKDFNFKFNSSSINKFYSEKIIQNLDENKIVKLQSKGKKDNIVNVHKDFNFNFNSSSINKFYSEKIIQNFDENKIVKLQPKEKIEFIKKIERVNLTNLSKINSLHFISSGW